MKIVFIAGGIFNSAEGDPIEARHLNGNGNESINAAGIGGSFGKKPETITTTTASTSTQPPSSTESPPIFSSSDEIIYGEKIVFFFSIEMNFKS